MIEACGGADPARLFRRWIGRMRPCRLSRTSGSPRFSEFRFPAASTALASRPVHQDRRVERQQDAGDHPRGAEIAIIAKDPPDRVQHCRPGTARPWVGRCRRTQDFSSLVSPLRSTAILSGTAALAAEWRIDNWPVWVDRPIWSKRMKPTSPVMRSAPSSASWME